MIPFVDFKRQIQTLEKEINKSLRSVFVRAQFILGQNVEEFEKEFARFCGTRFAVGVGNGTEAIQIALMACGVGPGDEVITAAHTAVPTASAISAAGATPVFADIHAETMTLDPAKIPAKMTRKTKAIVPVHLYGHPADMEAILEIARKKKLAVVEDACQAHGAAVNGRRVGGWGDAGAFSFYPTKNLGGYGDGGLITTNRADLYRKMVQLRNYGQTRRYHHPIKGINSRLDEIQAALLRVKLKRLQEWNERRREIAGWYHRLLIGTPLRLPVEKPGAFHVFHLYVVRSVRRDALLKHLQKNKIGSLIHYPVPVHLQPSYRDLASRADGLPETEKAAREVLSLPLYPEIQQKEVQKVAKTLHDFFS